MTDHKIPEIEIIPVGKKSDKTVISRGNTILVIERKHFEQLKGIYEA